MKTKEAFNTRTQQMEQAVVTIDGNGEFVFTFEDGSFFKLPADTTKASMLEALEKRQLDNEGQITVEAQEAKLDELLSEDEDEDDQEPEE